MTEIKTKGIDSIREKYLKRFGLPSIKQASPEMANKLFVAVIDDFKKGELSSDELATFGFELFHGVAKKNPDTDLFQASLSASELTFATRSEAAYDNIPSYLADIDKFYSNNK